MQAMWIAGSAGFLGARLAAHFSAQGWACTGLSRRGSTAAAPGIGMDLAAPDAVALLRRHALQSPPPSVVIHAAARQPARCGLSDYVRGNVATTSALLDAVAEHPPGLFILVSTQSVYGEPVSSPVTESMPLRATHPYGVTKAMAEQLVTLAAATMKVVILRLPSLFGKGQTDSLVDGFARLALENRTIELYNRGETVRDVLPVDAVVRAIAQVVERTPPDNLTIANLGAGRAYTAWDIAAMTVAALGSGSPVVRSEKGLGGYRGFFADIAAARERFGFHPPALALSLERYAHELQAGS